MASTTLLTPCSGDDVNQCVENCCIYPETFPRTCVTCFILCWRDETALPEICDRFCQHLTLQPDNQGLYDQSQENLQIVVYVLAVLVAVLAVIVLVVLILCCSRRRKKRLSLDQDYRKEAKSVAHVQSEATQLFSPEVDNTSATPKEKVSSNLATSLLNSPQCSQIASTSELDVESLYESFTDEDFYDAWSPSVSPKTFFGRLTM